MKAITSLIVVGLVWLTTAWYDGAMVDYRVMDSQEECQALVDESRPNLPAEVTLTDCVAVNPEGAGNVFGAAGLESLDSVQSGGE